VTFGDVFSLSQANLWRTRLRTFLTTLGVVIGIGALVSMVSFGSGMQRNVTETFREHDLFRTIEVLPGGDGLERTAGGDLESIRDVRPLDDDALESIRALDGVEIAFPEVRFPVAVRLDGEEAKTTLQAMPAAMGTSKPFDDLPYGAFFSSDDAPAVVVSQRVLGELGIAIEGEAEARRSAADTLRPLAADEILGRELEIVTSVLDEQRIVSGIATGGILSGDLPLRQEVVSLTIVGIQTRPTGFQAMRLAGGLLAPPGTVEKIPRIGFSSVWELLDGDGDGGGYPAIHVRARTAGDVEGISEEIEAMALNAVTLSDQLDDFRRGFLIMDTILGAIGAVALIVAALGITNTMVTSILERTREIGIMKALGGTEGEIRAVFLVEAGTIGIVGGALGLLLGWGVTRIANVVANAYLRPEGFAAVDLFHLPLWLIAGAVGFSVLVSLIAGVYPAGRAARVDPVRALRHD